MLRPLVDASIYHTISRAYFCVMGLVLMDSLVRLPLYLNLLHKKGTLPHHKNTLSFMNGLTFLSAAGSCLYSKIQTALQSFHSPAQNMYSPFAVALDLCESPLLRPDPSDLLHWAQCFMGMEQHQLGIRLQLVRMVDNRQWRPLPALWCAE